MAGIIITKVAEYGSEYDLEEVGDCVHGTEQASIVCGIFLEDGIAEYRYVNKAISCSACIGTIESRGKFVKRKGKWY